jgi:hypothetical protein
LTINREKHNFHVKFLYYFIINNIERDITMDALHMLV